MVLSTVKNVLTELIPPNNIEYPEHSVNRLPRDDPTTSDFENDQPATKKRKIDVSASLSGNSTGIISKEVINDYFLNVILYVLPFIHCFCSLLNRLVYTSSNTSHPLSEFNKLDKRVLAW